MNKCKICEVETKNKMYCSMKCRDTSRYINSRIHVKCKTCNKEIECMVSRVNIFCSNKCASKDPEVNLKRIKSMESTNLLKYNTPCVFNTENVKKKTKQTIMNKHGVEHYSKSAEYITKIKKTNQERYGVDFPQQNFDIKEKSKKTWMLHHGGIALQSLDFRKTVNNTNLLKYGYENPMQNEKIRKKAELTNLIKYGFTTPLKNENIMKKTKITLMEKYGVDNVSKSEENKEKVKESHMDTFYDELVNGNRLENAYKVLFTREEYVGSRLYSKKYPFKCNKCSNEFEYNLSNGAIPKCPVCYPYVASRPQQEVYEFIVSVLPSGSVVEQNNRGLLPSGKEVDIYIPEKKFAIEFNGIYWHSQKSGGKSKMYHIEKTKECESVGVRCIQIQEDEWEYKREIVKRKICHLLKVEVNVCGDIDKFFTYTADKKEVIYARKCIIKEIDSKTKGKFVEAYHIQGNDMSSIRFGAYYNGELVAVMTFGKRRVAMGKKTTMDGEYELLRFCVGDRNVVGIASKLFQHFIKTYQPNKITSYADRRYSDFGAFYGKIGFKLISETSPNYWYWHESNPLYLLHRFNFRKQELPKKLKTFDINLTEWENMVNNGWDRLWDCGNLRYEWVRE